MREGAHCRRWSGSSGRRMSGHSSSHSREVVTRTLGTSIVEVVRSRGGVFALDSKCDCSRNTIQSLCCADEGSSCTGTASIIYFLARLEDEEWFRVTVELMAIIVTVRYQPRASRDSTRALIPRSRHDGRRRLDSTAWTGL